MCLLKDKQRNNRKKSKKLRWNFFGDFFCLISVFFFCCFLLQPFAVFVFLILKIFIFFLFANEICVFLCFIKKQQEEEAVFIGGERCKENFALIWNILEGFFLFIFCLWMLLVLEKGLLFLYNKWVKKNRERVSFEG